jgi:probable HAF family extracellular repeat protein
MSCAKIFVALLLCVWVSSSHGAEFIRLGFAQGTTSSRAADISTDGTTVVGAGDLGNGYFGAFRWRRDTGMQRLFDLPDGSDSASASGVSADGSVVVGDAQARSGTVGFRWSAATGMVPLSLPEGIVGNAVSVSADGSVITGSALVPEGHVVAFLWTAATGYQPLGTVTGLPQTFSHRISDDGRVIVGYSSPGSQESHAFIWTEAAGIQLIGYLPGGSNFGRASSVSGDGSVIVGYSSSAAVPNGEPFRWTSASGIQPLPNSPPLFAGHAYDISADGLTIVGFATRPDQDQQAFMWDSQNGMRDIRTFLSSNGIDMTGWTLPEATGVSGDGTVITGWGINPQGKTEAWVAVVPEPASFSIIFFSSLPMPGVEVTPGAAWGLIGCGICPPFRS